MSNVNSQVIAAGERPLEFSVRDFIAPIVRRKRILLFTFLGSLAALLMLAAIVGPTYTARMSILANRERLEPLVTPETTTQLATPSTPIAEEEINSEVELLRSRDVLEKVVVANGLDKPADGWSLQKLLHPHATGEDRIARAVKTLAQSIGVKAVNRTDVIEVKYSSPDPKRSYGILRSLGEFYTQKHVEVHRPAGSYEVFVKETQHYREALDRAELALQDFTRNHAAAPDIQEAGVAAQVASTIGQMHQGEQSFASDEMRLAEDQQQMLKTPHRNATIETSAVADKLLDQLNGTLLEQETRRSRLLQTYDPSYPLIQDVDVEIAQTKQAIRSAEGTRYVTQSTDADPTFEALRQDVARTRADRAGHAAGIAAARHNIRTMEAQLGDLDRQAIMRQDLVRDAKAAEQSYLTYLGKREQERTSDALDTTRIANVAIAVPPVIPVLPAFGWPLILLTAIFVAGVCGVGCAYAADFFDLSFYTSTQVREVLGIPVVIEFPRRTA